MSTNKTTNYQINQWETEDRVLRGKADTATTDSLAARLTDVEGKLFYTKLLDYISSKSGSQIDLDVSDLDLTKYDSLEIRLDPVLGASYTTGFYLRLLVWPKRGGTAGVHHTERCPPRADRVLLLYPFETVPVRLIGLYLCPATKATPPPSSADSTETYMSGWNSPPPKSPPKHCGARKYHHHPLRHQSAGLQVEKMRSKARLLKERGLFLDHAKTVAGVR